MKMKQTRVISPCPPVGLKLGRLQSQYLVGKQYHFFFWLQLINSQS